MKIAAASIVFLLSQLVFNFAYATCPQSVVVDCKSDCSWGYNSSTGTYFPASYTTSLAQAAANDSAACTSTLIVIQGTKINSPGYTNYFFEFTVGSTGSVTFDGNSDVSHDQNPLPPLKNPGTITFNNIVYGIDIVIP